MNKTLLKRGRPKKSDDRVKADYLDIRLLAAEKQAFRDAADLAGLDLSAWVRERLRMQARKELEAASRSVAFLAKTTNVRRDHVAHAKYVAPSQMFLQFTDGFTGTWTFDQLQLDMANMKLPTVRASKSGTSVEVKSKRGERVQIDSSSLRVLTDPVYAAEIEDKLNAIASRIGL